MAVVTRIEAVGPYKVAAELIAGAKENGGATIHLFTGRPDGGTRGYYVGGEVPGITLDVSRWDEAVSLDYLRLPVCAWLNQLPDSVKYAGSWLHGQTVYIDAVTIVTNKRDAIRLAKQRGELAIWDVKNQCEILTS